MQCLLGSGQCFVCTSTAGRTRARPHLDVDVDRLAIGTGTAARTMIDSRTSTLHVGKVLPDTLTTEEPSGSLCSEVSTCVGASEASVVLPQGIAAEPASKSACQFDHAMHLPESLLGDIGMRVRLRGTQQTPVLYVMAMHDTCKSWRRAIKALPQDTHLLFDGSSCISSSLSAMEQRYKRRSLTQRRQFLHMAARRCSGEY